MLTHDFHAWLYTILFGSLSALIIGNNIYYALRSIRMNESTSFTLFIGSLFGVISILTAPVQSIAWLAVIPVIIDPGSSWIIYKLLKK